MNDFGFPGLATSMPEQARAERLRFAVKRAGGNQAVASRAGVPLGTLNNYLAGREMKVPAFVAIAAACNVSLDWLATGRGGEIDPYMPDFADKPEDPSMITIQQATAVAGNSLQTAMRDHQKPITPPPAIDAGHLVQAITIVHAVAGLHVLNPSEAAARILKTYEILIGSQP